MFHNPNGTFRPGLSFLHTIDARVKILTFAALLMGLVLTSSWRGLLLILIIALIIMIMTGNVSRQLRDIWNFRFFYFFTILIHLLFDRGGEPLLQFSKIVITSFGLYAGFFFSIKIAIIVLLGGLFTRSTHPTDLSKGIESMLPVNGALAQRLGRPGVVVGIALRTLPTILVEAERIRTAQIARGYRVQSGGLINTIKNLMPLIGPLLTATLRRGDSIHDAMVSRGFSLDQDRTVYMKIRMKNSDWYILVTGVAVSTIMVLL